MVCGASQIDLAIGQPSEPVADRRHLTVEHRRVRNDDDIGSQLALLVVQKRLKMLAADLLLALENQFDIDREPTAVLHAGFDRLEVHEDLTLVVRGATRINLAFPNGRLERRRFPFVQRVDRLHVVVPIKEDGRRPLGMEPVPVDDRIARRFDAAHVFETDALKLIRGPLGAARHVTRVLWERADTRNSEVVLQLLDVSVAVGVDEIDDVVHP